MLHTISVTFVHAVREVRATVSLANAWLGSLVSAKGPTLTRIQ